MLGDPVGLGVGGSLGFFDGFGVGSGGSNVAGSSVGGVVVGGVASMLSIFRRTPSSIWARGLSVGFGVGRLVGGGAIIPTSTLRIVGGSDAPETSCES
jgi:hypothetical protein